MKQSRAKLVLLCLRNDFAKSSIDQDTSVVNEDFSLLRI